MVEPYRVGAPDGRTPRRRSSENTRHPLLAGHVSSTVSTTARRPQDDRRTASTA
ncbi:hypothetical protein Sked_03590 [Sanguibacter keddieii DSM 10542]|uniref:Uncharacterized protein n=1 Tax=Sanguibacter keddieii (strain ATCC 51767 / DSM 10542 / NCFB 3025 / ST-74) TaxID=446469 RepID=D1BJS0_SANKS|nr:hypothetical protein Sked_03590 [Sanguibacter keddieii DSM 10542]